MFDLTDVEVESGFSPMPEGQYKVRCDKADLRDTKAGDGQYIGCQFTVIEGKFEGRKVFHNFNTLNKNEQAVKIGKSQLKTFLMASKQDASGLKDPADLIMNICHVYIKPDGDNNKISRFVLPDQKQEAKKEIKNFAPQATKKGF